MVGINCLAEKIKADLSGKEIFYGLSKETYRKKMKGPVLPIAYKTFWHGGNGGRVVGNPRNPLHQKEEKNLLK